MASRNRTATPSGDEPRRVEGHALVRTVLDRYLPPVGDWDDIGLDRAHQDVVRQMRRQGSKFRSPIELTASGLVTSGAESVLAARTLGMQVIPARWSTVTDPAGSPLDVYWVLFEHRLGWSEERAVCRCAYTYPLRVKYPQASLHPQHLAEALWAADLLAPMLNVKLKTGNLLYDHQPVQVSTHGVIVDQCKCGVSFDPDSEPGAWIQHRVALLREAGLVFTQRMRDLLR